MSEATNIRRSHRIPIEVTATLRMSRGTKLDVFVTNLTAEGCCIAARYLNLRAGDCVRLKIAEMEYLPSIVRWSGHVNAGLEFTHNLYEPTVRHLQARYRKRHLVQ